MAIATLALGIGASVLVFSAVRGVMFRRLPFPESNRLVLIGAEGRHDRTTAISLLAVSQWRLDAHTLSGIAAIIPRNSTITVGEYAEQAATAAVSPEFFSVLGVAPQIGRVLGPLDDLPGALPVVVLSLEAWRRLLGGSPDALGRTVQIDRVAYYVVGVMPEGFAFPDAETAGWFGITKPYAPFIFSDARIASAIGRLRPAMQPAAVAEELRRLGMPTRSESERAEAARPFVMPLRDHVMHDVQPRLVVMVSAAALVLGLALANVASLLLSEMISRERELAIRQALGARWLQIVTQLSGEGLVIGLLGGGAGLLMAKYALAVTSRMAGQMLPELAALKLDADAGLFAFGLSLLASVGFALAPMLAAGRRDLARTLHEGAGVSGRRHHARFRRALIVVELAVTVMMVAGTGLLTRTLVTILTENPGFDPANVLTARVTRPYAVVMPEQAIEIRKFALRLLSSLGETPGISNVAVASDLPTKGAAFTTRVTPTNASAAAESITVSVHTVTSQYFTVLRIPLAGGRAFSEHDDERRPYAVVIDQALARRMFGASGAIGRRLYLTEFDLAAEVVGVVERTRQLAVATDAPPDVYLPFAQLPVGRLTLLVRLVKADKAVASLIRRAVAEIDPGQPVVEVRSLSEVLGDSFTRPAFYLAVLAVFACISALLTFVGVYGVTATLMAQRTREIGIRIALGAGQWRIVLLMLRQMVRTASLGLLLGLGGAAALGRLLSSLVYRVAPTDALVLAPTVVVVSLVVLFGTLHPVLRAVRMNALAALHAE